MLFSEHAEEVLGIASCAGFKAGAAEGHHFQNRSDQDAYLLQVGSRRPESDLVDYPDIDLRWSAATGETRKDGRRY